MGQRVTQVAEIAITEPTSVAARTTQAALVSLTELLPNCRMSQIGVTTCTDTLPPVLLSQASLTVIRQNVPDAPAFTSMAFKVG